MAKLSAETRFAFASIDNPCEAMASLNDRITNLGAERFVTMATIVLDASSNKAKILIAGHMPPVRLDRDGKIDEPGLDVGGPPLGIMTDIPFEAIEVDIQPGESLTLYTDGIFEAPNAAGEQFSMERVRQLVQKTRSGIQNCGQEIMKQVAEHIVGCDQEDDMCLVIIGRDA